MDRYIELDAHAASCTLAVISETGKRLRDFRVETNGAALVEAVRAVPGRRHLIFEEGSEGAWLYETFTRHVEEIVVSGQENQSCFRDARWKPNFRQLHRLSAISPSERKVVAE